MLVAMLGCSFFFTKDYRSKILAKINLELFPLFVHIPLFIVNIYFKYICSVMAEIRQNVTVFARQKIITPPVFSEKSRVKNAFNKHF